MIFELSELSWGKVLLCVALVGAVVGLAFLFVGPGALRWLGLLLVATPIIAVVLGMRSVRRGQG